MIDGREVRGRVESRPTSVTAVVRRTRTALRTAHALEAGLLFLAAAFAVRAAAVLSASDGREAWGVALIAGMLSSAAWWAEHRVSLPTTAGELDRRLSHQGALVTAFELEARDGRLAPMEALVRERVLERLRPREALRTLFPPLLVPVGAPALAALAWVLVLDARGAPSSEPSFARLGAGLEQALAGASADVLKGGEKGQLAQGEVHRALQALSGLQDLERALESREGRDEAALRSSVETLDRELAALTALVPPASSLFERFTEARAWLDALRMGLPPSEKGAGAPGVSRNPSLGTGGRTAAAPEGTMSGSSPDSERPEPDPSPPPIDASAAANHGSEPSQSPGIAGATWWPAEYDGVVERWIELRRAALADEPR